MGSTKASPPPTPNALGRAQSRQRFLAVLAVATLAGLLFVAVSYYAQGDAYAEEEADDGGELAMGPALAAELAQMGAELQELHQASQKLQLEFQRKAAQQTLMMSSTAPAQQQAAAGGAQGGAPPPVNNGPTVSIDLHNLLGSDKFYGGVTYDPHLCVAPLARSFPNATKAEIQAVQDRLAADFQQALASVVPQDAARPPPSSFPEAVALPGMTYEATAQAAAGDTRLPAWQAALSSVLSTYFVHSHQGSNPTFVVSCPSSPRPARLEDLGRRHCPALSSAEIVSRVGTVGSPHLPLATLAGNIVAHGVCTTPGKYNGSYGHWLKENRMYRQDWKTFDVANLDQDAVVFLYDVMYESQHIFKRQYWLGTLMMQHPYDLLSIADIIWTVKPDLIIETGTANGGSALLWASLLALNGLDESRVLTLDLVAPSWDVDTYHWGGKPKAVAVNNPLWAKHVTFIQGYSTSRRVWEQVSKAAEQAKSVLVLLDSMHSSSHVLEEARLYCPFVNVGSYCVFEDTKLSRYSPDGPLQAVRDFVRESGAEWEVDRQRELLFTQHAQGYLRRTSRLTAPKYVQPHGWHAGLEAAA